MAATALGPVAVPEIEARTGPATVVVSHGVTVAAGVYAPGHVGELTQYLPFEVVDDVLELTRTTQRRLRDLPSRVGVYFLLALAMFPRLGYTRVWTKLTAAMTGLPVARPSEKALRDLRRRLGPAPLKALFEVVAGPLAQPWTPGVCFRGLRTVAFDGCSSWKVPDTDRNRSWLGKIKYRMGWAGYPTLRLMTLVETGTRALIGATLGSAAERDEATQARRLLPLLQPGMLLLLDRAFDADTFFAEVAATGAVMLARAKSTRNPAVLQHFPDGSYLSRLHGLTVRIIEADLTVTGADGSLVHDRYRLITTLLDHRRFPAPDLIRLYHERWEIESTYLALHHTLLGGHVLRSRDQPGLEQEVWAVLLLHQLLRMAMVTAVETRPGTDPDRASFTTALEAARGALTAARGICPDGPVDLPGIVGRDILATLLPPRRARFSARKVKCATSRYLNRDDGRPGKPTAITAIHVAVHTPPIDCHPRRIRYPAPDPIAPGQPRPNTRRHRVVELMNADPDRGWTGRELAEHLHVPLHNMLTQLSEWTRFGFLARAGAGIYKLAEPKPLTTQVDP